MDGNSVEGMTVNVIVIIVITTEALPGDHQMVVTDLLEVMDLLVAMDLLVVTNLLVVINLQIGEILTGMAKVLTKITVKFADLSSIRMKITAKVMAVMTILIILGWNAFSFNKWATSVKAILSLMGLKPSLKRKLSIED